MIAKEKKKSKYKYIYVIPDLYAITHHKPANAFEVILEHNVWKWLIMSNAETVAIARFAWNVEWDFLCYFQTLCNYSD